MATPTPPKSAARPPRRLQCPNPAKIPHQGNEQTYPLVTGAGPGLRIGCAACASALGLVIQGQPLPKLRARVKARPAAKESKKKAAANP